MQRKIFFKKKIILRNNQPGYTLIEFVLVILFLGLTFSISLPLFGAVINKAKQKEATLIVNKMLKAAEANYALEAFLPNKMKPLNKFAIFHKCISEEVEIRGNEVCNSNTITKTNTNDNYFYSPSGNYKVELRKTEISNLDVIFQVRAIPNGIRYQDNGSSVSGCFNPIEGVSKIKEYSFLDVGEKDFMSCFTALQIDNAEEERIAEEERKSIPICNYPNPRNPLQCFD